MRQRTGNQKITYVRTVMVQWYALTTATWNLEMLVFTNWETTDEFCDNIDTFSLTRKKLLLELNWISGAKHGQGFWNDKVCLQTWHQASINTNLLTDSTSTPNQVSDACVTVITHGNVGL